MSNRNLLLFRIAISGVLSCAIYFQGFMLHRVGKQLEEFRDHPVSIPAEVLGYLFVTTAIVLIGSSLVAALLIRSACTAEGRALATFLTCFIYVTGAIDTIYALRHEVGLAWYLDGALNFSIPLSVGIALAAILRFSALFPVGLRSEQVQAQRLLPGLRVTFLDSRLLWLTAVGVAVTAQTSLLAAMELRRQIPALTPFQFPLHQLLMILLVITTLLMAVANLRTSYHAADRDGRRRVYWVLEGLLVGTVLVVFASMLKAAGMIAGVATWFHVWYPLAFLLALLIVIVFLGIAMFYEGALDPRLALQRTAVTGLMGVAMVFIFAVTQQLVHEYLVAFSGISDRAGGMITGGIVALSFEPVQRRLNAAAGRWLAPRKVVAVASAREAEASLSAAG
jgi:hypothetical protein